MTIPDVFVCSVSHKRQEMRLNMIWKSARGEERDERREKRREDEIPRARGDVAKLNYSVGVLGDMAHKRIPIIMSATVDCGSCKNWAGCRRKSSEGTRQFSQRDA